VPPVPFDTLANELTPIIILSTAAGGLLPLLVLLLCQENTSRFVVPLFDVGML